MTNDADRQLLLETARAAMVAHVTAVPAPAPSLLPLMSTTGVFVTLHKHGDLRGCIGHLGNDRPLLAAIVDCARQAATADPRFPPVTQSELSEIDIEISILGPLESIASPDEIEIGRHGLVVEQGWYRGLLLPQVAVEWQWDRKTFVEQACHKAGLSLDAWQRGARLLRFDAEVFGELAR